MSPQWVWGSLALAGLAYEYHAIKTEADGDTLSEVTRAAFKVHTELGRGIFAAAWGGVSLWFGWHILYPPMKVAIDHIIEGEGSATGDS